MKLKPRSVYLWIATILGYSLFLLERLPNSVSVFFLSMWMPALCAIVFTLFEGDPIRAALNLTEGKAKSFAFAVSFPVFVAGITVALGVAFRYLRYNANFGISPAHFIPTLFIWIVSALGEEIGWRGYLHNHLRMERHAPLYIGLVWGGWHVRQLITEHYAISLIAIFFAIMILLSYFLSWLIESGGSVFSCAVFHGLWSFLRLRVLAKGLHTGLPLLFFSRAPRLTDLEGPLGLIAVTLFSAPFVYLWYRSRSQGALGAELADTA